MTSKTVTKNQSPLVPANDQEHVRQGKLQALKQMGRDPFRIDRFGVSSSIAGFISRHHALKQQQSGANLDLKVVRLAGRVLNVRAFGGVVFLIIADCTAKLQLFCPKNQLSTAVFNAILALDRGDIIGCRGTAMMTKTQQLSLQVRDVKLLAKSVKVWPNKFQGLVDTETKYRQRYLDLVLSARSRAVFMCRAQIITALRAFLNRHRYIEVETPVLEANFGGASARPFTTTHHAYNTNFYLRIAPELALKRLIVGGLERVYELGKVFRNEGIDADHSPEFTSLEVYTAYHNVTDTMRLCERLVRFCCQRVFKTWEFKFKTHLINFQPPFQRHHILDLLGQKLNHDFWQEHDLQRVRQIAVRAGVPVDNTITTADEGIMLLFEKLIEPDLIQPTFVVGHPASLTPLAKTNRQFPQQVDRFELYVAGMELANAYSELNDPFAQLTTFQQQVKQAATIARTVDHDYVRALAYGMPPCGGLGIGIDRLVMVLTGASNIRDVILFPTLKPVARR